ncbi:hypothetical protein ABT104_06190 [Streptomyces mobaraensis]
MSRQQRPRPRPARLTQAQRVQIVIALLTSTLPALAGLVATWIGR